MHWTAVAGTYYFCKKVIAEARKDDEKPATLIRKSWVYFWTVVICLAFGWISASALGTHTERSPDPDEPGRNAGRFCATENQRWNQGVKRTLIVLPPALLGVYSWNLV